MELKDLILFGVELDIRENNMDFSTEFSFKKRVYSKTLSVSVRVTKSQMREFKTNQEMEQFICQKAIERFKAQGYSILGGTDGKEAAVENQR
jgi:hypothetical protein